MFLSPPWGVGGEKMKDYAPCGRVIRLGVLNKEKALQPPGRELRALLFPALRSSKLG